MLFNSIEFAIFLPIVFILYWFVTNENLKIQNLLIVVSSYIFYGWWDWRFLSLIVFSTLVDYLVGRLLQNEKHLTRRKLFLWSSITVNLGLLGFFKYYNFFLDNFIASFSLFGKNLNADALTIILPVGISFYTFQTLSYTIDVYKEKLEPTRDLISFAAFVSFFPQLVAGPIERATNLLPQFEIKRTFSYTLAVDGTRQILWGLFKKVVIADNCAHVANLIFNNSDDYSGSTLLVGAVFFSFQIYGDFSGYSDIAIGISRLFGFNLMRNFAFPYFSRDIAEFWRRWHISLSTWFRDYLYIPLGGSRGTLSERLRNTLIIFVVSGFWHGANWTFIFWGTLNALYFIPVLINNKNRKHLDVVAQGSYLPSIREFLSMFLTFSLVVFAWIFFRANDINHALNYVSTIFSKSLFTFPSIKEGFSEGYFTMFFVGLLIVIEWIGRESQYAIAHLDKFWSKPFRWVFYLILSLIIIFYNGAKQEFIYFQF